MEASKYVRCVFILACLMNVAQSEKAGGKMEQQFINAFTTDGSVKMKRPFCNAFTGCGRKRSFHENMSDYQDLESRGSIRLPLALYKILLSAAFQNVRNTIDRNMNEYQLSGIPPMNFPGKTPLRKGFDVPPTTLD